MNSKSLLLGTVSLALCVAPSVRALTIGTSATQPTPGANDIYKFTNPFGAANGG